MNLKCPICSNPLTSKTTARTLSPMWSEIIRDAEREGVGVVGVCYECGHLCEPFDFNDDSERVKAENHILSAGSRSRGQRARHAARKEMEARSSSFLYAGQTVEGWIKARQTTYEAAKATALHEMAQEAVKRLHAQQEALEASQRAEEVQSAREAEEAARAEHFQAFNAETEEAAACYGSFGRDEWPTR